MTIIVRKLFLALALALALAGCASLPSPPRDQASYSAEVPADSLLKRLVTDAQVPPGRSGVWPMPVSSFALDARIASIRAATGSLDLQYYIIGNDTVGRLIFQELRAAAQRGVRVRLLVDDFHTAGLDPLLAALAVTPNAEVRLFNPFVWGRASEAGHYAALLADYRRLNHRMHNKLFIADSSVGIVGGRNLADEYFFLSGEANFLDIDFVVVGAVIPRLGQLFDGYWNSDVSYPALSIISRTDADEPPLAQIPGMTAEGDATDVLGQPSVSAVLRGKAAAPFHVTDVFVHADSPSKANAEVDGAAGKSVTAKFLEIIGRSQHEVLVFNPYFIPGTRGMEHIKRLRSRGVRVAVVTNSIDTSDEPLVSIASTRYREDLLASGVRIFELSDGGVRSVRGLRDRFGGSKARLHAKLGFVDRETVLAGSMNLDARSAFINTEIGVMFKSPEITQRLLSLWDVERSPAFYEIRRTPDGAGLQWVSRDAHQEVVHDAPPEGSWYLHVVQFLQSLFVPEDAL